MRDWDDLRFLLALQRAGSLARAAEALEVDKATVSRRVAALGEALGLRLIERVGQGYRLTEEAGPVVAAAQRVDGVLFELEAQLAAGAARGPVRLTVPAFLARVLVIPALPRLREAAPEVDLLLLTSDRLLDLARREADVAVRNVRSEHLGMVTRRLGAIAYALYGSRPYLDRTGRPATRDDLGGRHLVLGEHEPVIAHGFRWLLAAGLPVAFRASDMASVHEAVRAGVGLGVLPCVVGDEDAALERVAATGLSSDDVWATFPEDLRDVARVRAVVDWLAALWTAHAIRLHPPH